VIGLIKVENVKIKIEYLSAWIKNAEVIMRDPGRRAVGLELRIFLEGAVRNEKRNLGVLLVEEWEAERRRLQSNQLG